MPLQTGTIRKKHVFPDDSKDCSHCSLYVGTKQIKNSQLPLNHKLMSVWDCLGIDVSRPHESLLHWAHGDRPVTGP